MRLKYIAILSLFSMVLTAQNKSNTASEGIFAEIQTKKGSIVLELHYEKAPVTVANFISLAEGNNPAVDAKFKGKPYYDGLKFHRVIANFMIQGGDPDGTGAGGPGYKFGDEITDLTHAGPGVLSMANAGPATNGSQFFITHKDTPWLDGKHTVFGSVVKGQEVVNSIEQNDVIEKIVIERKGAKAKKFDAVETFKNREKLLAEHQKKQEEAEQKKRLAALAPYLGAINAKKAFMEEKKKTATAYPSGLKIATLREGLAEPQHGSTVYVHYSGFLESGEMFDSSDVELSKQFGNFNQQKFDANAYKPIPHSFGTQAQLIPGFLEGINKMKIGEKALLFIPSNLAYGSRGAGGVIPPNANLIFEIILTQKETLHESEK